MSDVTFISERDETFASKVQETINLANMEWANKPPVRDRDYKIIMHMKVVQAEIMHIEHIPKPPTLAMVNDMWNRIYSVGTALKELYNSLWDRLESTEDQKVRREKLQRFLNNFNEYKFCVADTHYLDAKIDSFNLPDGEEIKAVISNILSQCNWIVSSITQMVRELIAEFITTSTTEEKGFVTPYIPKDKEDLLYNSFSENKPSRAIFKNRLIPDLQKRYTKKELVAIIYLLFERYRPVVRYKGLESGEYSFNGWKKVFLENIIGYKDNSYKRKDVQKEYDKLKNHFYYL